jgi:hypothetical protein
MDTVCLKHDVTMYYHGPLSATGNEPVESFVFFVFTRLREDSAHGSHIAFVLSWPFGPNSKDNRQGRPR